MEAPAAALPTADGPPAAELPMPPLTDFSKGALGAETATRGLDVGAALEALIAHAEAQMNAPASSGGTKRLSERVSPVAGPSKRRRRLVKVSESTSGVAAEPAAGTVASRIGGEDLEERVRGAVGPAGGDAVPGGGAGQGRDRGHAAHDVRRLQDGEGEAGAEPADRPAAGAGVARDLSEQATGSRRSRRRAMKERVVADFFGECQQQRATLAAREEETFGPPSSPARHDTPSPPTRHGFAADFQALETLETDGAEAQEQEPVQEPTPTAAAPTRVAAAPSLIDLSASFDGIRVPPPALI
ncbi:hypothetical protein KFL_002740190 [Klebsormidium nitens]|uniref:Uncharacterized protein n=1 Tax=Klebsormidium nitens TaxID=105231 RepID=A0A1Y1IAN4_KLENI|nr:hypothetical protein KFL_002740190 [Klebsormidium nitens]|eukprot:GAQ86181.1 hypothetical protein KFL_002740190 [Klebsormidium nitens]